MNTDIIIDRNLKSRRKDSSVAEILRALNSEDIEYAVLRGCDELFRMTGYLEIDLLVRRSHLSRFSQTVSELGFMELPSWGHAPHRFYVVFNKSRADWIKLDVVTDLRYGNPIRGFAIDLTEACLRERQHDDVYRLSPENEFVTLLLHCLLDKAEFREAHRKRLTELWRLLNEQAQTQKSAKQLTKRVLSPCFRWTDFEDGIKAQDWRGLLGKRKTLTRQLFWRAPLRNSWRTVSARIVRRLRPLLFAMRRRGYAAALLAPDGAGKSTLAGELIKDRTLRARGVYLGGNPQASKLCLPTTDWFHRRLKSANGSLQSRSPHVLFLRALTFATRLLEQWLRSLAANYHLLRGRIVIFDRYIYDSWINKKKNNLWKRVRKFMFEAGLPKPELVIFLDAPGDVLFERKQEHTPEWLEQQRQAYLRLQDRLPNMHIINAASAPDKVKCEATDLIWEHYVMKVENKR
ncbi:hypothetical protein GWO43_02385 [candidate division KSB1 bacterium]|nr:hypothetical protein [candidate division KSB1 bacterium]NIR69713.1 hypothetical protein [candidate division KSB1 bacterium]NIS24909.1 hypothetical protein [candidate division KSB1 bacterium]NIT69758.1 hypothetical protein [candidate division KSB1 bacterium]NIU23428.1 hypothetical protein [candidate division KSB1 bacterium]